MAAVDNATAPRPWQPGDLRAIVERSIDSMKAEGWLVEEQITTGRFRRGRGLRVDWPCTPWPKADVDGAAAPSDQTAPEQDGAEDERGQLVNGVVND